MQRHKKAFALTIILTILMMSFTLVGCGGSSETSSSSSEIHSKASSDNTKLEKGSWTGEIDGKEVTIESAYIVDGIEATIDGSTWESAKADQTVFLVVNGGSLNLSNALIEKSNGDEESKDSDKGEASKDSDNEDSSKDVEKKANNNSEEKPSGQPPEKPSDDNNSGEPPSGEPPKDAPGNGQGNPPSGDGAPGGTEEDNYNFYGLNSAIVCVGEGSSANIENCQVTTDADGANAVFAANDSKITADGIYIETEQNSSRGLYATYGGSITATNVYIKTQGAHCAPLATDRGGGLVKVTGESNKLESHGEGSPCIYSTGDIQVEGATGTSEVSETLVIEGKNKVSLKDCDLSSKGGNGIMLYQSMSGDAADEDASNNISSLNIEDSKISYDGDGNLLYVTNTNTEVSLKNVEFDYDGTKLISAAAGKWGNDGENGGTLSMSVDGQALKGTITADDISQITLNLKNKSSYDGDTSGSVDVKADDSSSI